MYRNTNARDEEGRDKEGRVGVGTSILTLGWPTPVSALGSASQH